MVARLTAMLLVLAASAAFAQQPPVGSPPDRGAPDRGAPDRGAPERGALNGVATGAQAVPVKRIFTPPPVQWDNAMLSFRPALQQTATDFANLTGGLGFGMSPAQVNARLPAPYPEVSWNDLSLANEYPGEVRYLGVSLDRAGPLRMGLTACPGSTSYLVFLFNSKGLFRISYRLAADRTCADTNEAARQIFARYVSVGQSVAQSLRYRTGKTEVVDITDPTVGDLALARWRQGIN